MFAGLGLSYIADARNDKAEAIAQLTTAFGALDSGRRWVDDAISSGEMLRGDIRSLALEIELTSNILSPVPLAATQWPTTLQQTNAVAEQH